MPTVTTGAVVSGATTTSSPFASLVLSIPIWSRFTRCPLSPLLLNSLPLNSFAIPPAYQQDLARARVPLLSASSHARRVTAWLLPPRQAHDRRPSPLPRDIKVSCFPRRAEAFRR